MAQVVDNIRGEFQNTLGGFSNALTQQIIQQLNLGSGNNNNNNNNNMQIDPANNPVLDGAGSLWWPCSVKGGRRHTADDGT